MFEIVDVCEDLFVFIVYVEIDGVLYVEWNDGYCSVWLLGWLCVYVYDDVLCVECLVVYWWYVWIGDDVMVIGVFVWCDVMEDDCVLLVWFGVL